MSLLASALALESKCDDSTLVDLRCQVSTMQAGGGTRNGAIVINEGIVAPSAAEAGLSSAEKRSVLADSDYARQLQAKMDVQESRAANKSVTALCCQSACKCLCPDSKGGGERGSLKGINHMQEGWCKGSGLHQD